MHGEARQRCEARLPDKERLNDESLRRGEARLPGEVRDDVDLWRNGRLVGSLLPR
jgi:hypothetical protein